MRFAHAKAQEQRWGGCSCGVFMLCFIMWLALGLKKELEASAFGQLHILRIRTAFAAAILLGRLPLPTLLAAAPTAATGSAAPRGGASSLPSRVPAAATDPAVPVARGGASSLPSRVPAAAATAASAASAVAASVAPASAAVNPAAASADGRPGFDELLVAAGERADAIFAMGIRRTVASIFRGGRRSDDKLETLVVHCNMRSAAGRARSGPQLSTLMRNSTEAAIVAQKTESLHAALTGAPAPDGFDAAALADDVAKGKGSRATPAAKKQRGSSSSGAPATGAAPRKRRDGSSAAAAIPAAAAPSAGAAGARYGLRANRSRSEAAAAAIMMTDNDDDDGASSADPTFRDGDDDE